MAIYPHGTTSGHVKERKTENGQGTVKRGLFSISSLLRNGLSLLSEGNVDLVLIQLMGELR